ncbi:MAG: succinylglutamate desuccinylase/aspartoacylase family protein, partial [Saprospiraceae bacterium]
MESPLLLLKEDTHVIKELNLSEIPGGKISRFWVHLVTNGMGMPTYVPVIVAKGEEDGPVLGITAAVHGNELNGVSVIQRLFRELDVRNLKGTVIGIPAVNIPSLLANQREFIDGTDINDIMPGKAKGNMSEVYAYRFVNRIVKEFDYLVDLHTASFGRINSYYIR